MSDLFETLNDSFHEFFEEEETLDSLDFDENIIYEDYDDE